MKNRVQKAPDRQTLRSLSGALGACKPVYIAYHARVYRKKKRRNSSAVNIKIRATATKQQQQPRCRLGFMKAASMATFHELELLRTQQQQQRRESKICLESERSSSVRAERDILGDEYRAGSKILRRPSEECECRYESTRVREENQWIQRPSRPQGQPRVDLDQEKISTSCGESGGPAFGHCVCESYAPTRPPGLRSSRLPSTGYSGTLGGRANIVRASASVVVSRDSRECAARLLLLLLQCSAVYKVVLSEWYAIYNSSPVAAEQSTRIQRSLFYAKRDDDVVATAAKPRAITFDNIHAEQHTHTHINYSKCSCKAYKRVFGTPMQAAAAATASHVATSKFANNQETSERKIVSTRQTLLPQTDLFELKKVEKKILNTMILPRVSLIISAVKKGKRINHVSFLNSTDDDDVARNPFNLYFYPRCMHEHPRTIRTSGRRIVLQYSIAQMNQYTIFEPRSSNDTIPRLAAKIEMKTVNEVSYGKPCAFPNHDSRINSVYCSYSFYHRDARCVVGTAGTTSFLFYNFCYTAVLQQQQHSSKQSAQRMLFPLDVSAHLVYTHRSSANWEMEILFLEAKRNIRNVDYI
ncbi:unnamed protein product [Trichogramma brassicae]|uniref:Uncharacterized protein n=1 Tax=Trichogramma brassicae TaxID=86971 RepID=A0A6H5I2U5_9HYME|nr:unnamed protein product [Trichogramma brassicae]